MYVCARSLGSVLVGGLLGLAAMTLVNKNRELLVGTSVPPKRLEHVLSILESDPVVHSVHDVKAIMIGMSFPLPRRFLADFPSLFVTRSVGPASARVRDIRLKMFIQPITNHQSPSILSC